MKNIRLFECNIYATAENGINYRAVKCGEGRSSSHWRLAKEDKPGYSWKFVNETKYRSGADAIADIDYL